MSDNSNKENKANRSGINSGASSQQRSSKRAAFSVGDTPSFLESDRLTNIPLRDNAVIAPSAVTNNSSNAAIALTGSNSNVPALAAAAPSAVTHNSNGYNNSVAINIDTEIARYQREASKVGAQLLRWDPKKASCPMTMSTNSTASGKTLKIIGAAPAICAKQLDGTVVNFFSLLASDKTMTQPRHFGSVEYPIQEWKRTHSGVDTPGVIFYQRQKPDEKQVFSINDVTIVVPPKWVLEFCDHYILPLSNNMSLRHESRRMAGSIFANNGRKTKLLATMPSKRWAGSIMGVAAERAYSGEVIHMQYMDGNELKSTDVFVVSHTANHGAIGKVTKLGSKVLPRAYLVHPVWYNEPVCRTLNQRRELSAKFVS